MKKIRYIFLSILIFFWFTANSYGAASSLDDSLTMGIPLGGADELDVDICPAGMKVIEIFMNAWDDSDYRTMYELIDDENKEDYTFEDAKFDFRFMKFIRYGISSIRKDGENFEFILSTGNWRDGDKDVKKMIISGTTFKIVMPKRGKLFKESLEDYF